MELERLSARKELTEFELSKLKQPDGSLYPSEELTEEAKNNLSDHERLLLVEALQLWEEHDRYITDGTDPYSDPTTKEAFIGCKVSLRQVFEDLVLAGLLRYTVVQDGAIEFGVIPDPKDKFRFFRSVEGIYCCWTCGDAAMIKDTHLTVRLDQMPLSGPGAVITRQRTWCPSCETEPPSTGIIMLSQLADEETRGITTARIEFP